jgi:hypothetical protein
MKKRTLILLCLISTVIFSQKKIKKKFEINSSKIEISSFGLDNLIIENSNSDFIEIFLMAENSEENHIIFKEEYGLLKIKFKKPKRASEDIIFRKFITERLNRASAVIKVPKNIEIFIFGDEINVESKSYQGDLNIFIEKGILKLNNVNANLLVKMYEGNLYAALEKANINVFSKTGKIKINTILVDKIYQNKMEFSDKKIGINSLKANIFLTTQ